MSGKRIKYNLRTVISAIVMVLSLLWLTISLPIVNEAQKKQQMMGQVNEQTNNRPDRDDSNPFANTTEEKAPSSVNLAEEYLHHHEEQFQITDVKLRHTSQHTYNIYVAFHGELISPPPEA